MSALVLRDNRDSKLNSSSLLLFIKSSNALPAMYTTDNGFLVLEKLLYERLKSLVILCSFPQVQHGSKALKSARNYLDGYLILFALVEKSKEHFRLFAQLHEFPRVFSSVYNFYSRQIHSNRKVYKCRWRRFSLSFFAEETSIGFRIGFKQWFLLTGFTGEQKPKCYTCFSNQRSSSPSKHK